MEKDLKNIFSNLKLYHDGIFGKCSIDDKQLNEVESLILISNPNCKVLSIPAWDISPYDNSSPNKVLNGQRISTLSNLVNNDFLMMNLLY